MRLFKKRELTPEQQKFLADKRDALYDTDALERIAGSIVDRGHLSEEMVQGYINAARADCYANTLSLINAQFNQGTLSRQMARYRAVTGFTERLRVGVTELGISLFGGGAIGGLGIWSTEWHWLIPTLIGGGCAFAFYTVFQVRDAYRRCFARALVIERASFCYPDQPTALLRTNLPRLAAYNRPELWNGPNARNGVFDKESFLVYQTGMAEAQWQLTPSGHFPDLVGTPEYVTEQNDDGDEVEAVDSDGNPIIANQDELDECQRPVACKVVWGKPALELTHPRMIYDLAADTHRAHTTVMKARRGWHRRLQQAGNSLRQAQLQSDSLLDGNWQLLCFLGCVIVGLLVMMLG